MTTIGFGREVQPIEIAVLGQRARENKRNVYIRDAATGELLQQVGF